ncbi:MAG: cytochrome b561 [Moritella sp.]|jgi:cytochrome b561
MHTPQYSFTIKFMHWLMAITLISLLVVGYHMTTLVDGPYKVLIYDLHKAFGLLALILLLFRVMIRLRTQPASQYNSRLQLRLSQLISLALYLLMLAMPISGILFAQSSGQPITFFGLFDIPTLVTKNDTRASIAHTSHEIIAYLFWLLIILHVMSALYTYDHSKFKNQQGER